MITICSAGNAAGNFVPPILVFPKKKFKNHFIRDGPNGCVGAATSSGWMEPETFLLFMKHFVKTVKVNIEHPVLLLLDNHYSHLAIDVLDCCKYNGVVLLSFLPHCFHKLQPLDRKVCTISFERLEGSPWTFTVPVQLSPFHYLTAS